MVVSFGVLGCHGLRLDPLIALAFLTLRLDIIVPEIFHIFALCRMEFATEIHWVKIRIRFVVPLENIFLPHLLALIAVFASFCLFSFAGC